jgi:hypothetical protein
LAIKLLTELNQEEKVKVKTYVGNDNQLRFGVKETNF